MCLQEPTHTHTHNPTQAIWDNLKLLLGKSFELIKFPSQSDAENSFPVRCWKSLYQDYSWALVCLTVFGVVFGFISHSGHGKVGLSVTTCSRLKYIYNIIYYNFLMNDFLGPFDFSSSVSMTLKFVVLSEIAWQLLVVLVFILNLI